MADPVTDRAILSFLRPIWAQAEVQIRDLLDLSNPKTGAAMSTTTIGVLGEVATERARQDAKWGEQNHRDGTGCQYVERAEYERIRTNNAAADGTLTWRHILAEEVYEAFAEADPARLRAELVQVAAVAIAWAEALDRRTTGGDHE
jgi:hypothetical protein